MINHPNRNRKIAVSHSARPSHDHDYTGLLAGVRASFATAVDGHSAVFQTDAEGLYDLYLASLPSERQVHTCHCCRRFIGAYGGLVTITENGETFPVMWNPNGVPEFYHASFAAMYGRVKRARVDSVFLTNKATWGTPITGEWSHPSVIPGPAFVYRERALTAGQAMAAAKENFRTVATALAEFTSPMLDQALRLLEADTLARSEKFIGPARWLRTLQDRPKGKRGENILWRAIAAAPEGFCHPKTSVIGPLLDDIAAGLPFAEIKARFDAKMHPLRYQRPQAAPAAGNIAAAEKLVEKLGIAPALERRFARLDELQVVIWRPAAVRDAAPSDGVFGHLKAKGETVRAVDLPPITMTWDKFTRTVLEKAEQIEILVPYSGRFIALTTAVHADAPPIMKWDREDERDPVCWYVYHNGSPAMQWELAGGSWAKITAVVPSPGIWGILGETMTLVIEGAADSRTDMGNALFPECLREELHGTRAVIEAYSRTATLSGRERASACGYAISKNAADCKLRVLTNGAWSIYQIDRWD